MEGNESSVTKVFSLPELLDAILGFLYASHVAEVLNYGRVLQTRDSAALMRVNTLFYQLTTRYIWSHCGVPGQPRIRDLARLAIHPERLKWYTSCIQEIMLDYEDVERQAWWSSVEGQRDLHCFKRLLPALEFPRLDSIIVRPDGEEHEPSLVSFTVPYLRHTLRSLCVGARHVSIDFWKALEVK